MKVEWAIFVVSVGLLTAVSPVLAHHSSKAEYDENQPITLTGSITRVFWKNPHVMLYLNIRDESGKVTNWELELASPNGLMSQGWKVDSLKPGDQVTVSGNRAKDGSNRASAKKVTLGAP
jgi:hypothetical protein